MTTDNPDDTRQRKETAKDGTDNMQIDQLSDTGSVNNDNKLTALRKKQPPIIVENLPVKDIIRLLNKGNITSGFVIKNICEKKINICTDSNGIYLEVKNALIHEKVNFYTFTHKDEKFKTIVLK